MRSDSKMNLVNDHVFIKEESSAFSIIALNDFLKQNNAKEIVMIGLMAEGCLYESVIAGKELGYNMYVLPEAIIGNSKESKDKVMQELESKGIKRLDIPW
jgi:nicotinamidase-related amidase